MNNFRINADTVLVLIGFISVLAVFAYTRDSNLFTLAATLGGAVAGVAKGSPKQETQIDNVEKATVIDNK